MKYTTKISVIVNELCDKKKLNYTLESLAWE